MRFIILCLIFINMGFSSDINCGESEKREYKINKFNIVECNCNCTSKENIFYIEKDKNIAYKIDGVSVAFDNKVTIDTLEGNKDYYESSCKENKSYKSLVNKKDKDFIYFFTKIPDNNDGYCLAFTLVFNGEEFKKVQNNFDITITKYINISQKIQLYKTPSEETITKMYLIAGDKADLLEEKTDEKGVKWYNILYHGKKDINAWIKADESINLEKEDK